MPENEKKKYAITDWFWIDEDLRIKAILTTQSDYWYVRYNLPGVGQRKQSLKTRSKKQARIAGSRFARQLVTGEAGPTGDGPGRGRGRRERATTEAVAAARCERLRHLGRSEKSVAACARAYAKLAAWARGKGWPYLDQLTAPRLEAFESDLRERGVAVPRPPLPAAAGQSAGAKVDRRRGPRPARPLMPKTVRDTMKMARGLIRFALRRGTLERDPAGSYELPAGESEERETFTPAELAAVYADPDPAMAEVWEFLTHTCLRASEFCWLLKADVTSDRAGRPTALQIQRKKCPQTGRVWVPKHGTRRTVLLTDRAAAIVAGRLAASAGPWLFEAADTASDQPGKWHPQRLLKRLALRLKAAGVTHGTLHTFRHTGASFLANDPVSPMPLPQLQRFLGHRRITTTETYLHARAEDVGASLRRVDFARLTQQKPDPAAAAAQPQQSPPSTSTATEPQPPATVAGTTAAGRPAAASQK